MLRSLLQSQGNDQVANADQSCKGRLKSSLIHLNRTSWSPGYIKEFGYIQESGKPLTNIEHYWVLIDRKGLAVQVTKLD